MVERRPSGARIRERRQERGLRQAELAGQVGISPSYLNLIEHGRRRIGGKLLQDIARALDLDPAALSDSPDLLRLQALRAAARGAEDEGRPQPELDRAQDLADRFPGWAALIAQQARTVETLRARMTELAARLRHDQALAHALHQVISGVTAIRATAGILTENPDLDRDWQVRFLRNIRADSEGLAQASRDLARVLEEPQAGPVGPDPQDEAERWLDARDHHLPELERGEPLTNLPDGPAGDILRAWARRYAEDAAALPLSLFLPAAREAGFDPGRLAHQVRAPLPRVLRRLAALPPDAPPLGLVVADASGTVVHRKAIEGLPQMRAGLCPLWPLFEAMTTPGRGLRAAAAMPGEGAARVLCHAVAAPVEEPDWGAPPRLELTMLLSPLPPEGAPGDRLVGPTCRLCPRAGCPARREASILG